MICKTIDELMKISEVFLWFWIYPKMIYCLRYWIIDIIEISQLVSV